MKNERFEKVVDYGKFNSDKFIVLIVLFLFVWTIAMSLFFIRLVPEWNTQFSPLGFFIMGNWFIPAIIGVICYREVYYKKITYKRGDTNK